MGKYIFNRLWQSLIVLIGVTLVTFILLKVAPGDPVAIMLNKRVDAESIARLREEWGLNRPQYVQYFDFVWKAMHGDLGTSYFQNRPVTEIVVQGFKITLVLSAWSLLFASIYGIVVGTIAAVNRGKAIDHILMFIAMFGISAPVFWVAVLLQILFGLKLGILPISGMDRPGWLIMPIMCLTLSYGASSSRLVRTNMIEVLSQEYIRTARAKGVGEFVVVVKHVLKNAAIPIVTLLGMQLRSMLCGAMVLETVFSINGLGKVAFDAITKRDLPIIQGTVVYTAAIYVFINLIVDLMYGFLDPRIRIVKGEK